MRIAACCSDVDGLCRCHKHCRAARDRIAARSDCDRGTLSLPPSYTRLISPASASAMVRRQGQNELQQVQRGSTSGRLRKSTSMMATPLSKCMFLKRLVRFRNRTLRVHYRDCRGRLNWASGILYTWTGLGKSVHTGTYQYVLVQHGTRQYENLTVVRTGMYWYIPVRTLKKTSCFLTHPERVRRDKIKAVQLLCMGYNVAKLNFKTTQV